MQDTAAIKAPVLCDGGDVIIAFARVVGAVTDGVARVVAGTDVVRSR